MNEITEEFRIHFSYNDKTGEIKRITKKNSNGSYDHYGYLILKYKGMQYKAHRIAWFLHYGVNPKCEIDHINGKRDDNRISNLRTVTRCENCRNIPRKGYYEDNSTKGLHKRFRIRTNGKTYGFYNESDAISFRISEDKKYNFTRRFNLLINKVEL